MKELVDKAKINKFFLPSKIVTDKTEILRETNTANEFNNFFSFLFLFFYQGFLSRTLTTHRTAGEGRGPSYFTLLLPPTHKHPDIYLQFWT